MIVNETKWRVTILSWANYTCRPANEGQGVTLDGAGQHIAACHIRAAGALGLASAVDPNPGRDDIRGRAPVSPPSFTPVRTVVSAPVRADTRTVILGRDRCFLTALLR